MAELRGELKFAVTREDPELESELVDRVRTDAALVVASGGCTALALARRHPGLRVVAFDVNPVQLEHVRAKQAAVAAGDLAALNVDDARPDGLNQRGAFERLLRLLRRFIEELVAPPELVARLFDAALAPAERDELLRRFAASRYWPAAFATAFNDPLLVAMFGPDAIQHAVPGSYPGYFQAAFERGLRRADAASNPFLQHVLLGRYLPDDAPDYVRGPASAAPELVLGSLADVPDLDRFGLYSLSNVFDWSDDALISSWAERLKRCARGGSAVLIRQINNRRDLRGFFAPEFRFDAALGARLLARDRSLFYERVEVGIRT